MPEISVLMSVYNGKEFINEAIDSILNQTYSDFELRLFDLKTNIGVGSALKYGLTKVQGRYLAKADADDINHLQRFKKQKKVLDDNREIALVKTLIDYFPHDEITGLSPRYLSMKNIKEKQLNSIITSEQIKKTLYWWCCIPHNSYMARAEIIKQVGYEEVRMGEDYKLFYGLNRLGYKMTTIEEKLVKFRVRNTSITGSEQDQGDYVNTIYNMKKEEIDKLFKNKKDIYIWGTGNLGQKLFNLLQKEGFEIKGFIDRYKERQGIVLCEKSVYSPEYLNECKNSVKVIIAAQPAREEIANYLDGLGFVDREDYFVFA